MAPIHILLSDFQFLTREGLKNMIDNNEDFELAGVVEGADELLETVARIQPEVLILDYENQEASMLSLLTELIQTLGTNVLIITNDDDKVQIQNLLELGIKGIVTKSCSKHEIINAIHSISQSNRFFCNRILDIVMAPPDQNNRDNCEPTDLSPREYEVLVLITKSMKTVEIADKLNVSVHTINSHRKNILKKLNLKSPAELIVYAIESKLVPV